MSIPETMQAARWHGPGSKILIEEVPVPDPGPGELLIRVAACGVCASDLHMFDGSLPTRGPVPVIPGHEAAGTVVQVGVGSTGWSEGDAAAIFAGVGCGDCPACQQGKEVEQCWLAKCLGIDRDGAWAEYIVVPAVNCVKVPEGVPLEQAAILCDAVGTPYNAVLDAGNLRAGESVAVFGIGGLGTHGVALAKLAGASTIIAVDPLPAARERAVKLGADHALDPTEGNAAKKIKELTGWRGVDLAIDFVGVNAVLKQAVSSLALDGRCILVGVSGERIELGPSVMFAGLRSTLRGIMGYRREHLEKLVELVAAGRLDVSGSITHRFDLADAEAAVHTLSDKSGSVVRVVLIPPASSPS
ncbi:MAG: zinc-dependent alcohol dehydrogenase [Actinomycetota bacterium]